MCSRSDLNSSPRSSPPPTHHTKNSYGNEMTLSPGRCSPEKLFPIRISFGLRGLFPVSTIPDIFVPSGGYCDWQEFYQSNYGSKNDQWFLYVCFNIDQWIHKTIALIDSERTAGHALTSHKWGIYGQSGTRPTYSLNIWDSGVFLPLTVWHTRVFLRYNRYCIVSQ